MTQWQIQDFPEEGCQLERWGTKPLFWPFCFCKNCSKMKNLDPEGMVLPLVDLPMSLQAKVQLSEFQNMILMFLVKRTHMSSSSIRAIFYYYQYFYFKPHIDKLCTTLSITYHQIVIRSNRNIIYRILYIIR